MMLQLAITKEQLRALNILVSRELSDDEPLMNREEFRMEVLAIREKIAKLQRENA